tara:strand:+ start:1822 stop:2214 length:393 start_codon:yes stop_codon:yes gene_type:complete
MIIFYVVEDEKEFQFNLTDKILDVKNALIKDLELKAPYIDLLFLVERPIRNIGHFNIEKGVMSRVMDQYELSRFGLKDNMTLNIGYKLVDNYKPFDATRKRVNLKKKEEMRIVPKEATFKLDSEDDFPSL